MYASFKKPFAMSAKPARILLWIQKIYSVGVNKRVISINYEIQAEIQAAENHGDE